MSGSYINESKMPWFRNGAATTNDLILGCLQRIADATERSCMDREQLERRIIALEKSRDMAWEKAHKLERQAASLRGVITKLKNKAERGLSE